MTQIDGCYRRSELPPISEGEDIYSRMNTLICHKCARAKTHGFGGEICADCLERNMERRIKLHDET